MKILKLTLAGCLAACCLISCSEDDDDQLNSQDRTFLTQASISNTAEVNAATLASTKATNGAVKAFAMHMLSQHNTAQTDLKNLGANVGHAVKDTLDPAHVTIAMQLSAMSGRAFDSAYIHTQVIDHQATITFFQNEQSAGQHEDVKRYANTYLPHIQSHHQRADSIARAYFRR
jgi:putative membrane protein